MTEYKKFDNAVKTVKNASKENPELIEAVKFLANFVGAREYAGKTVQWALNEVKNELDRGE